MITCNIDKQNVQRGRNGYILMLIIIGIFILGFLLAKIPRPEYFISDPDGAHQLAGAMQILSGDHPFINFRSSYGPLTFYASALGQVVFGNRIIGEIMIIIFGYLTAYIMLFMLFHDVSKKLSISFIALCIALVLMPRFYKYYIILGPSLTLLSVWKYIDNQNAKSFVLMAFSTVITGLYRFDFGVYTGICSLTAVILINLKKNNIEILKSVGIFLTVIVAFASPWLIWALIKGGMVNYVNDTLFGILYQGKGLSLPFPHYNLDESFMSNTNITFALFVFYNIIPATSLFVLYILKNKLNQNEKYKIFSTVILAQLTLIQATHRSDIGHLLQSIPIGFVLIVWLLRILIEGCSNKSWVIVILVLFIFFAGPNLILIENLNMLPEKNIKTVIMNLKSLTEKNDEILHHIKCNNPENEHIKVIDYIKSNTHQEDKILVIPFLPSIYYFADRKFGGGQMLLAPGYFSLEKDQKRMVERLIKDDVTLIVEISDASYDGLESRKICNFASIVSRYLSKNYTQVNKIGKFSIKTRNIQFQQTTY